MINDSIFDIIKKAKVAEIEANNILKDYGDSYKSRILDLESLRKQLTNIPIDIFGYFDESLKCLEAGYKRAAMIMVWSGFFYIFSNFLFNSKYDEIKILRPKWKFNNFDEFRENKPESQILDLAKELGTITKADLRVLQGYLSIRNKCAHPTLYQPTMNGAIGYINELLVFTLKYIKD